jgi:hypothetical protein
MSDAATRDKVITHFGSQPSYKKLNKTTQDAVLTQGYLIVNTDPKAAENIENVYARAVLAVHSKKTQKAVVVVARPLEEKAERDVLDATADVKNIFTRKKYITK